ncbi:hypothetical protein D3C80_1213450 [compost metagenome]
MLADQLIHQQRIAAAGALQDHHNALGGVGFGPRHVEHPEQLHQRQIFPAHLQHPLATGQRMQIFSLRLQRFHYRVERQDKHFIVHLDRHAIEDRQR